MDVPKKLILILSTSATLSVSLFFAAFIFSLAKSIHHLTLSAQDAVKLELFFKGEINAEMQSWLNSLKNRFEIQNIEILDQQQAQTEFVDIMKPEWGDLVNEKAILSAVPSSLIFQFQTGLVRPRILEISDSLIKEAMSFSNYDSSYFQKDWAEWLAEYQSAAKGSAAAFFILVLGLIYLVTSNLNRYFVSNGAKLIEVKSLVGATHWQIVKPFLLRSVAIGVFASSIAIAANEWAMQKVQGLFFQSGSLLTSEFIQKPIVAEYTMLVLFVVFVCLLSAERCVREQAK